MTPTPVFFPRYLDLTEDESRRYLRQYELEAYGAVITALRSQGELNKEKRDLLSEIREALGVSPERHRAEIRRAVNNERLSTIALRTSGSEIDVEWVKEGHRMEAVPQRPLPITKYMEEADRVAEILAKENAALPDPSSTGKEVQQESSGNIHPPVSLESMAKKITNFKSSLYCIKCALKCKDMRNAETSTADLFSDLREMSKDMMTAPPGADSFVYLPGGTTVRVEVSHSKKDEKFDAYSYKSTSSGNIDFGSAPEISLTGTKVPRRQRKKSVGPNFAKEMNVAVKQVIRPEIDHREEKRKYNVSKKPSKLEKSIDSGESDRKETSKVHGKQKMNLEVNSAAAPKKKRRKSLSQPVAIQHTPVPPEHLYAVGSQRMKPTPLDALSPEGSQRLELAPTQGLPESFLEQSGHTQKISYRFQHRPFEEPGESAFMPMHTVPRYPSPGRLASAPSEHQTFHYSPSKPHFPSSNLVHSSTGKPVSSITSKRYRLSSTRKKTLTVGPVTQQSSLKRMSASPETSSTPGHLDDPPRKIFHPRSFSSEMYPPMETTAEIKELETRQLPSLSSGLDDLASVSLVASSLINSTIVETGLAPVSAIVSRVASPAPAPLTTSDKTASATFVSGANVVKPHPGQKTSIIVVHKAPVLKFSKTDTQGAELPRTGPPKNILTPSNPRQISKVPLVTPRSESALGSIQGLVSGLTPTSSVVKSTKFASPKPELIQKKTIIGKIGDPPTAKVIKVIGGPGKSVQIRTSTVTNIPGTVVSSHLRTIQGSRIVKPVVASSIGPVKTVVTQSTPATNIIAAAFNQSVSSVGSSHSDQVTLSTCPPKFNKDGSPSPNLIKVATSTPAASTIRAFAATYKKNSSTSQQKQLLSLSTMQKPLPTITSLTGSKPEKSRVYIPEPMGVGKHRPTLFTPNQPQLHRTHVTALTTVKSSCLHSAPLVSGTVAPQATILSAVTKSISKPLPYKVAYQQSPQQLPMQVKVLANPSSISQTQILKHPWRSTSVLGQSPTTKESGQMEPQSLQAKIVQSILDPGISNPPTQTSVTQAKSTGDRATFIYQYHSTPSLSQANTTGTVLFTSKPTVATPGPAPLGTTERDVITLHTVVDDTGPSKDPMMKPVSQPTHIKPNLVKINIPSMKPPEISQLHSDQGSSVKATIDPRDRTSGAPPLPKVDTKITMQKEVP